MNYASHNLCPNCRYWRYTNKTLEYKGSMQIWICAQCGYCSEGSSPGEAHRLLREQEESYKKLIKRLSISDFV